MIQLIHLSYSLTEYSVFTTVGKGGLLYDEGDAKAEETTTTIITVSLLSFLCKAPFLNSLANVETQVRLQGKGEIERYRKREKMEGRGKWGALCSD
jgi:hypothetical protein